MSDEKIGRSDVFFSRLGVVITLVVSFLLGYLFAGLAYGFGALAVVSILIVIRAWVTRKRIREGKETLQPWSTTSKLSLGLWIVILVGGYLYGGLQYAAGAAFFMVLWGVLGTIATYDGSSSEF
jgi:ABC-type iron transport system FetAB permease component